MAATILRPAPVDPRPCRQNPAQWWDLDNPNNDIARALCERSCPTPEYRECKAGITDATDGVIRAGQDCEAETAPETASALAAHHNTIAELVQAGVKCEAIAAQLGCSESAVYRYRRANLPGVRAPGRRALKPGTPHTSYRGVSWRSDKRRWRAAISVNGRKHHLGSYATDVEAARAYDAACARHGIRFRNFPYDTPATQAA